MFCDSSQHRLFPPGNLRLFLLAWWNKPLLHALTFFKQNNFRTYQSLLDINWNVSFPFWTYLKIRHFWVTLRNANTTWGAWQNMKNCAIQTPLNDISKIYSILFHIHKPNEDRAAEVWTNDLALPLSEEDRSLMNVNLLRGFGNVNIQETSYKLSCRWYHTWTCVHVPPLLSQMGAGTIFQRRTPYYIWWSCSKIRFYWTGIQSLIRDISRYEFPDSLAAFQFHQIDMPPTKYKRILLIHLLNAAKTALSQTGTPPRYW